jgi:ABC-2 type transport system permease protein
VSLAPGPAAPKVHVQTRRHGPSALGSDPRRFWNLTVMLAATDFKLRYFGSVLGYLWSLLRPLGIFGVMYVLFAVVLKVGHGIRNYPGYLLTALVLWQYFGEGSSLGMRSLLDRENLLRKVRFPSMVVPLAVSVTTLYSLLLNLIAVFVFLLVLGITPRLSWLELVPMIGLLFILVTGISMLLSPLFIKYRDIGQIWDILLQAGFYASPIFYVAASYPATFHVFGLSIALQRPLTCSPIAAVLTQMRKAVIDPGAPSVAHLLGGTLPALIPVALTFVIFGLGFWVYNRETPRIAENL